MATPEHQATRRANSSIEVKKRPPQLAASSKWTGDYKSLPMAMMPPTIVVAAASAPTVMMAATAVMAPPMTTAVTVAAPDLDDSSIGTAETIGRCRGHCGSG